MNTKIGRAGNFSSSKINKLTKTSTGGKGFGVPALTYIEEKRMEKRLQRQLEKETTGRAAMWGQFIQHRVTNVLLDSGCKPTKDVRRAHPTVENWTGAEDYVRSEPFSAMGEIKCFELKNFVKTHEAATIGWATLKDDCPEVAWQLVSHVILGLQNKVITEPKAELTLYVPYLEELSAIRAEADQGDTPYEFQWIKYAKDEELPYLIKGADFQNLTSFVFDIPKEDMDFLTSRVELANKFLNGK